MTDFNTQEGSRAVVVTETGVVKNGRGSLKRIITTATSTGTLVVKDGTEESVVAVGTITQSVGAATPAIHAYSILTSTGASAAATHASGTLTVTGAVNFKDLVKASAILTSDETQPTAGKVVVIGDDTYTFAAAGTTPSSFVVPLGTTTTLTMANLYAAIRNNADVDVVLTSAFVITVTAKIGGTAGNSIAATEDDDHLDWDGANTTLTGGLEAETVTIGTTVYRFKEILEQAYDVLIGSTSAVSLVNLKAAVNATSIGTLVGMGTIAHTSVVGYTSDATTMVVKGRVPGTSLNAVATTETGAATAWGDTTLVDGVTTTAAITTIGTTVYTQVDVLSETYGAAAIPYQILRGATEATMLTNMSYAINGTGTEGTNYSTGTVAHVDVIASDVDADELDVTSRGVGDDTETARLTAIVTTCGMANTAWEDTTLGGATGSSVAAVSTDAAGITIGTREYIAVTALSETTGASAIIDQILWVTDEATFIDNLKKTINQTGVAGTDYSTGTLVNALVVATTNGATTQVVAARTLGANGNLIATTATLTNYAWGAATLASGTGADAELLLNTYTPAAGDEIDLGNLEFTRGLFVTKGGTSISSTFILN